MLISYSHRFIFLHVYKVAGSSIKAALRPYAQTWPRRSIPERLWIRLWARRLEPWRHPSYGQHVKAKEVRRMVPPEEWEAFFKFAFVRNPWDWQVSQYFFMRECAIHHQSALMESLGSFEKYLEWRVSEDRHLQKEFVTDERGALIVDFVGRYETLQDDFAAVCHRIGVTARLPHRNASRHRDYRAYYTAAMAELVAEAFREDIEYFGYTFDGVRAGAWRWSGAEGVVRRAA